MSQRKLARKATRPARPNLRLVPKPRPRRRTRRRRLSFRWSYKRAHELHRHEERVVLRTLCETKSGMGSVEGWEIRWPGRWDGRYLAKVFKRLSAKGYVHAIGTLGGFTIAGRWKKMGYKITDLGEDALRKGRV